VPYKVKVDHPNLGEQSLFIHGLGTFANNTETIVDDEQGARFQAREGKPPEAIKPFGVTITKVQGGDQ
jgi:hypothetical protein